MRHCLQIWTGFFTKLQSGSNSSLTISYASCNSFSGASHGLWKIRCYTILLLFFQFPLLGDQKDVDSPWQLGICLPPTSQGVFILQHHNTTGLDHVDVPSCCTQLGQFGRHCCQPTLQGYARENMQVGMVRQRAELRRWWACVRAFLTYFSFHNLLVFLYRRLSLYFPLLQLVLWLINEIQLFSLWCHGVLTNCCLLFWYRMNLQRIKYLNNTFYLLATVFLLVCTPNSLLILYIFP